MRSRKSAKMSVYGAFWGIFQKLRVTEIAAKSKMSKIYKKSSNFKKTRDYICF